MKKRLIALFILGILLLGVGGCSKVITLEDIMIDLEGRGKFTISNGISMAIGNMHNSKLGFHPMGYDNGVVTGIVTSAKLKDWDLQWDETSPIIYKEYKSVNGEWLDETGNLIDPSHLEKYKMDNSKANSISIVDNKGNIIYTYSLKDESDLRSEGIEDEDMNRYFDSEGNSISISSNYKKIMNDYGVLTIWIGHQGSGDVNYSEVKNVIVNIDTGEIFEGEFQEERKINNMGFSEEFVVVNNEIYIIKSDGEISGIKLIDGKIIEEYFYDLGLSQEEVFMFLAYGDEHVSGENLFFSKATNYLPTGGVQGGNDYVFNFNDKSIVDLGHISDTQTSLEKVFPGSDGLVLINRNNYGTSNRWIARYNNGNYENIQMIEVYRSSESVVNYSVENILYDDKTNSFFLKRRIDNKDDSYYTYEYLTID